MLPRSLLAWLISAIPLLQANQDDAILEKGDKVFAEAKAAYELAREKSSVEAFLDAGFKLEEARIKYIVVQEIGSPEKQKIAADRLRAVNQLGKLIHDGKVAVTGKAVDAPTSDPAPSPTDPGKSAPPPAALDITVRPPLPDAARLREAEKL